MRGESREARRCGRAILGLGKSKERGPGRKGEKKIGTQLEVGEGKAREGREGGREKREEKRDHPYRGWLFDAI